MDETFYHTLRVGIPPAGGVRFGIDRLLIILTDSSDIIDVIPFSTYHESQKSSQLLIGVFDCQDLPIPEHTLNLRRQRHERHVILRVFIDGSTYDIDPSIDIGLAPTLPIAHWDGTSNTATMASLKHLRVYRPHSLHERILSQLRSKLFRGNPKEFYIAIDKWLADTRSHQSP